jgi:hypothetical protein
MDANNSFSKLTLTQRIGKKVVYRVENQSATPAGQGSQTKQSNNALSPENRQATEARRQQQTQTLLAWLEEQYPRCFNTQNKKPLKIGIHKELRQLHPEISHRGLARALRIYIRTQDYYTAMLKEKKRYDLQGQPCGTISKADKARVQTLLE